MRRKWMSNGCLVLFILLFPFNLNALKIKKINHSCLCYEENHSDIVIDYYRYMISLVNEILVEDDSLCLNIIIGNRHYDFRNANPTVRINFNYEHTLVKKGGRSVPSNCPFGNITVKGSQETYHVRIDRYEELNKADLVIDYSIPNIYNIQTSEKYPEFSQKLVYMAPSLYDPGYFDQKNRSGKILTTFINVNEPRRKKMLERMKALGVNHNNVNNCFDKEALRQLYCGTKILINIHQTEHHHTFEELRVLPALLCGVLVVCEESPLSHLIPYHEYVIWAPYDKIIETAIEVSHHYEYYHHKIFGGPNHLLAEIHQNNKENLLNALQKY